MTSCASPADDVVWDAAMIQSQVGNVCLGMTGEKIDGMGKDFVCEMSERFEPLALYRLSVMWGRSLPLRCLPVCVEASLVENTTHLTCQWVACVKMFVDQDCVTRNASNAGYS